MKLSEPILFSLSAVPLASATGTVLANTSHIHSHSCAQITPFVQRQPKIDYGFDPNTITGHLRHPDLNLVATPIPTVGIWEEDISKFPKNFQQTNAACRVIVASPSSLGLPGNTAWSSVSGLVNVSTTATMTATGTRALLTPVATSGVTSQFGFLNLLPN
jgi:hypothetical protein